MHALDLHVVAEPRRATRVILGSGAIDEVPALLADAGRVVAVVDEAVAGSAWGARALDRLAVASADVARVRGEEASKRLGHVEDLCRFLAERGADRSCVIAAIGGGVVSDLAGFTAATWHRGVPWLALPTTTLGMADAALGGKTGVNLGAAKNLVGAVHHPLAVVADVDALASLPAHRFREGFAEVVKAGVVGDTALLEACERDAAAALGRDAGVVASLLFGALRVKAAVVAEDERETSRREILNFGHTVGHALEHATDHALSHGEAVAIGMVVEARLAESVGRLPSGAAGRIARALDGFGLPVRPPGALDTARFREGLALDKKRRHAQLRVALPSGWGTHEAAPSIAVETDELVALVGT